MSDSDIIGIDLGTTHSAMAVPGALPGGGEAVGGVTVITDDYGRRTYPSVVAVRNDGTTIVGHRAKQRAGLNPQPIMFSKRAMGTDVKFDLAGRELRPQDAAAEILKYLKATAEKKAGREFCRAVITVPAYFDHAQTVATREAAEQAGLEAEILLEPIASAIMYLVNDGRDPLRIMVYDLGGGTFDVTILEKRQGELLVKAFGGDPYLGGYDFDKALVSFICGKLQDKGYQLSFDLENSPEDQANYTKLLVNVAEQVKIALSSDVETSILKTGAEMFPDRRGEQIEIDMDVTRAEFESLILGSPGDGGQEDRKTVERTIELCRETIAKAGVSEEAIDEIVCVGGSSYIPAVLRRLEEAFGRQPQLVEPELAVAVGAALKARELVHDTVSGQGVRVAFDDAYPRSIADSSEVDVSGRLIADTEGRYRVMLTREDGGFRETLDVGPDGGFLFSDVELLSDDTCLYLEVVDESGQTVASSSLEFVRRAEVVAAVPTFITKPLYVERKTGPMLIAPEATALPYTWKSTLHTVTTGEVLILPILEDDREVGTITIPGLGGLPEGTPVEATVEVSAAYTIHGRVKVPAPYDREGSITVDLPPRRVAPVEELKRDFARARARFEEALASNPDSSVRMRLGPRGQQVIKGIDGLFEQRPVEADQIARSLARLNGVTRELERIETLKPTKAVFDAKVGRANELHRERLIEDPTIAQKEIDKQIEVLKARGESAYTELDSFVWREVNDQLDDIIRSLKKKEEDGEITVMHVLFWQQQMVAEILELSQKVEQMKSDDTKDLPPQAVAEYRNKLTATQNKLKALKDLIQKVDVLKLGKDPAIAELQKLYHHEFVPLKAEVEQLQMFIWT